MTTATKSGKKKSEPKENWYVVPDIELRVHESWVNLIVYTAMNLPFGDLEIEINNGQPTKRLKEKPNIRFDKQVSRSAKNGTWYYIESLDVHIHEYWINLIRWCQDYFTSGKLEIRLVVGCPTELISASQKVYFNRPETIPLGVPLEF